MFGKQNKGNKYKCECVQKPKTKLSEAGCEDDAAAVAVLPYQWAPMRGGPILAKYLKEKNEKHIQAVMHLEKCIELINKNVETKIRILAETLLCHINNNQCEINCVIQNHESIENSITSNDFRNAIISIENTISDRIQDINEFKNQALKLERDRANDLKKVLRDNFRSIIAIGNVSPKHVLKDFDDKIYEVNQQLLSNCSAYIELETQLRAQADQSQRKARSIVNQLSLGIAVTQRGSSALLCPSVNRIVRQRSKSADIKINSDHLLVNKKRMNTKDFDILMTTLIDEYQKAIAVLYEDFLEILKGFNNSVGHYHTIHNKDSCNIVVEVLDQKIDEIIKHLSEITFNHTIEKIVNYSIVQCIKLAKRKLIFIGNELIVTYSLLHQASHLWDAHMLRVALAQKLTFAAIEEIMSRHDSLELASEVTFNVALEQLATANDIVDINKCYDVLVTLIQQKTDEYLKHNNAEMERLNEYENVRIPLTNTIKAEIDLFLYKHPIPTFSLINEQDKLNITRPDFSGCKIRDAFAQEIFQTELQAHALANWRNGFLEKLEINSHLIIKKIEQQIHVWVKERSYPLIKRHSLKTMSLELRKERVTVVRDLRMTEILKHEQCLQSHLEAIDHLTKNLPTDVSQYITLDTPGLHPLHQWINSIEIGMKELEIPEVDDEVKMLKVMSYSARLTKHQQLFEESLNPKLDSCKKVFENRVHKAMASNLCFISSLKLLHEGGNHSVFEALEISSFLVNGNYALESCMHNCLSALHQLHDDLITHADKMINPLQVSAKATLSETGKSVKNKRKSKHDKRR